MKLLGLLVRKPYSPRVRYISYLLPSLRIHVPSTLPLFTICHIGTFQWRCSRKMGHFGTFHQMFYNTSCRDLSSNVLQYVKCFTICYIGTFHQVFHYMSYWDLSSNVSLYGMQGPFSECAFITGFTVCN